jgi:hypothetical protein
MPPLTLPVIVPTARPTARRTGQRLSRHTAGYHHYLPIRQAQPDVINPPRVRKAKDLLVKFTVAHARS